MIRALAVCLAAALVLAGGAQAPARAEERLPAVGEVIHGFAVREVCSYEPLHSQTVLFEHERTGAEVLYVANGTENRLFALTFRTRPVDDAGAPDVTRRMIGAGLQAAAGTESYPDILLTNRMTSYQLTSRSQDYYSKETDLTEEQLLAMAAQMVAGCLRPSGLDDEALFREAVGGKTESNDILTLVIPGLTESFTNPSVPGNALAFECAAKLNACRAAFPGASVGLNEMGGADAPADLTLDGLNTWYQRYYQPSNSLSVLFGRFDQYSAFLRMLDDAFAPFDRREPFPEDAAYTPIDEPVMARYGFPTARGTVMKVDWLTAPLSSLVSHTYSSNTLFADPDSDIVLPTVGNGAIGLWTPTAPEAPAGQAIISYTIVCPGLRDDAQEEWLTQKAIYLLCDYDARLEQHREERFPEKPFICYVDRDCPETAVVFMVANASEDEAEDFRDMIDRTVRDVVSSGFQRDQDAPWTDSESVDVDIMMDYMGHLLLDRLTATYAAGRDMRQVMQLQADSLANPAAVLAPGDDAERCLACLEKWLSDSRTTALTVTVTQPEE